MGTNRPSHDQFQYFLEREIVEDCSIQKCTTVKYHVCSFKFLTVYK
jgi:hypothetical protein